MAGAVSIRMIGNWDKQVGVPLRDALAVSMDVCGRTGEEACRHAIILMAQSARALTKQSKMNRPVLRDPGMGNAEFVEVWNQKKREPSKLHRFRFSEKMNARDRVPGTWENARKIGNRGLGKRSWMWGLGKIGGRSGSKPIQGASKLYSIRSEKVSGYIKENRLSYITAAMPSGWEREVELRVGNKIMAQARQKMERAFAREVRAGRRAQMRNIQSFFKAVS